MKNEIKDVSSKVEEMDKHISTQVETRLKDIEETVKANQYDADINERVEQLEEIVNKIVESMENQISKTETLIKSVLKNIQSNGLSEEDQTNNDNSEEQDNDNYGNVTGTLNMLYQMNGRKLPMRVKRTSWNGDFVFEFQRIENNYAVGNTYRNGDLYKESVKYPMNKNNQIFYVVS